MADRMINHLACPSDRQTFHIGPPLFLAWVPFLRHTPLPAALLTVGKGRLPLESVSRAIPSALPREPAIALEYPPGHGRQSSEPQSLVGYQRIVRRIGGSIARSLGGRPPRVGAGQAGSWRPVCAY